MKSALTTCLLLAAGLGSATAAVAQTQTVTVTVKIGYVNSERVLREATPAKAAQAKLEAEFGKIDILVNVAGNLRERMIWNMSEDDFDAVVTVHLKGHWNMAHHAIKYMRQEGYGRIVNFSSDAFKGSVGQCNYSASKAGIIALTPDIILNQNRDDLASSFSTSLKVFRSSRRSVASTSVAMARMRCANTVGSPRTWIAELSGYIDARTSGR